MAGLDGGKVCVKVLHLLFPEQKVKLLGTAPLPEGKNSHFYSPVDTTENSLCLQSEKYFLIYCTLQNIAVR